jgi:hypothetical protein
MFKWRALKHTETVKGTHYTMRPTHGYITYARSHTHTRADFRLPVSTKCTLDLVGFTNRMSGIKRYNLVWASLSLCVHLSAILLITAFIRHVDLFRYNMASSTLFPIIINSLAMVKESNSAYEYTSHMRTYIIPVNKLLPHNCHCHYTWQSRSPTSDIFLSFF